MEQVTILWADDEIDLLKPHVLFLEQKGFTVVTVNNGEDALDQVMGYHFDLVFLDENMPGLNGLETLVRIKEITPTLPVIMITKSEEEHIMEDAIGSKISDYLIKPVNPNQILLSIKKNLDTKRLVSEKSSSQYQREFREIGMTLSNNLSTEEWTEVYKKIVHWDLELEKSKDRGMFEILNMQKNEANAQFCKYIEKNYLQWVNGAADDIPLMSHNLLKERVFDEVDKEAPLFLVVIDNLRYDQWKILQPVLNDFFRVDEESLYFGILPTATQYARNALFAGLMPSEIQKMYPKLWLNDEDEGGKNQYEADFLTGQLKRLGYHFKHSYNKITNLSAGKKLVDNFNNLLSNDFNAVVYNFVDMLSHARTDMEVIRELADDEAAYRSITLSWFEHSPLLELMKLIAQNGSRMVITTDHGTIHVKEPSKVVGDKNTNTNLRYKNGKSLQYNAKDVFEVKQPADAFLPRTHLSTSFIFAKEDKFFAYPNNYNYYVNYYRNTFQHGGISLEEVLIPLVHLSPK